MSEHSITKTAVVLIETPDSFILQRRPNLPGKLAYPDKLQFLGGHVEDGEEATAAAAREVFQEETNLDISPDALTTYWEGEFEGRGKYGEPVLRHVTLCYLGLTALGRDSMQLLEGGELVQVEKSVEAIEAYGDDFTPFARDTLIAHMRSQQV